MTRIKSLYSIAFSFGILISVCHSEGQLDEFGLESGKKEKASIWYSRGNSIIFLSLIGFSAVSLSNQPEVGVPIFVGALIGQYSGLAIVGNSAETYCAEVRRKPCPSLGWTTFWTSLSSLGVFYYELANIAIDENRNREIGSAKATIGILAGGLSFVTYLYSWYSFYRVKTFADERESLLSISPILILNGEGAALGLNLAKRF
jgi:hypothetical protein